MNKVAFDAKVVTTHLNESEAFTTASVVSSTESEVSEWSGSVLGSGLGETIRVERVRGGVVLFQTVSQCG